MINFFKILISIYLSIFIINLNPLFSHGSKGDCSNECQSYYCPELNKEDDQKSKKIKNKS